jgi:tRNA(adenine34) deaminase
MSDPRNEQFMGEALQMASLGLERGELPIGAVVVWEGRVIAAAHTQERTQERLLVHADLLALEAADKLQPFPGRRRDTRLFVTLEPCLMCLGAAMSFFLGEIQYALESPGDGAVSLVRDWRRDETAFPAYRVPRIEGGLLREDSLALFREYVSRYPSGAMSTWARRLVELSGKEPAP